MARLWVVEDNDTNFELVEFLLGEAGHEVSRAADLDGVRVLLAAGDRPRVVLLDMSLGSASGLEVLELLGAEAHLAGVPVVALTAHAMRGDRERFLAAGCAGYLAKPIDASRFVSQVEAFLGGEPPR